MWPKRVILASEAIYPDDKPGYLQGKALSAMAKAPDGNLWIATEDAGIAIYNPLTGSFRHLLSVESNPQTISTNNACCWWMEMFVGQVILWAGLRKLISKPERRYVHSNDNPFSLNNNFVFSLHFLSPDSILVGTIAGIELFDKRRNLYAFAKTNLTTVLCTAFYRTGWKIWICTYNKGILCSIKIVAV